MGGAVFVAAALSVALAAATPATVNILLTNEPAGAAKGPLTHPMLACEEKCTHLVRPQMPRAEKPFDGLDAATFDAIKRGQFGALVDLNIDVAADGHVTRVIIERELGPAKATDEIVAGILKTTLVPATEDGKPIDSSLRYRWSVESYVADAGTRPYIVSAILTAAAEPDLVKQATAIDRILADPSLNLPERALASLAHAKLCLKAGDQICALEDMRDATVNGALMLNEELKADAIRQRIALEAHAGQYADALAWADALKTCCDGKLDDATQAVVTSIATTLADPAPLAVAGVIATDSSIHSWHHTLVRRTFAFQHVGGKGHLRNLALRCNGRGFTAEISEDSQWTVPKSWGDCELYVFGTRGTTFQLVEVP